MLTTGAIPSRAGRVSVGRFGVGRGASSRRSPAPTPRTTRAPYILEVPDTSPATFEVDLARTCGELQAHETVLAPQGYTFEAGDLGCPVDWPQALTFRLAPTLLPDRLQVEAYGSVADSFDPPLTSTPAGYEFHFRTGPLTVHGTVVSTHPNVGAVVDLEEISWNGLPVCVPSSSPLPPEE